MSYAAFKLVHAPTGIENCCSAFLTHSSGDDPASGPLRSLDSDEDGGLWPEPSPSLAKPNRFPNLILTKGNVVEVYNVRVEDAGSGTNASFTLPPAAASRRGGVMAGISTAWLELSCHYRLQGNVESIAVLSHGKDDGRQRRDAIVLSFRDAKAVVLEFEDSSHGLAASSMHYFEGPDWHYLKKGRERFSHGPLVRSDPQGRCAGMLLYDSQIVILKAALGGYGLGDEDDVGRRSGGTMCAHVESSYVIDMREFDIRHIKDIVFLHGYIEPVLLVLYDKELTWAGRVAFKRNTSAISALSINTSLKQHPLIWSVANLPYDVYMLLAVPSPIGGVIVVGPNSIHYHSQSASCTLALNEFAGTSEEGSSDWPRSKISVELDAARATWVSHDVALFSTKAGNLLLLTLVYDGRTVQRLELTKSRASVLTSCICMVGDMFFFLGSRLGDSLLVQVTGVVSSGTSSGSTKAGKEEHGDIEGEVIVPPAKRMRQTQSEGSQDGISAEELSLYHASTTNPEAAIQKNFEFAVRDSLTNIGPLRDFAYGLRTHADASASAAARQSNYELVACSGHGKNGSLSILQQSVRPDLITEVELPGCKGMWTVYYKGSRGQSSEAFTLATLDAEFHAYLIISLENRTMVLETGETLGEVTESVDYYTEGATVVAGNLFSRRRVVQVYARGVRLLDGAYMTQESRIESPSTKADTAQPSESVSVQYASIADPYVLLKMTDGSVQLVTGDPATCSISISAPAIFQETDDPVTACSLYHDRGPSPWLRRTSTDAWLAPSFDPVELSDGSETEQADIYCIVCKGSGGLLLYELPNFVCIFSFGNFTHGKRILYDSILPLNKPQINGPTQGSLESGNLEDTKQDASLNLQVIEVCLQKWPDKFGRPFLLAVLSDGTMLCYHGYIYEGSDSNSVTDDLGVLGGRDMSARLKNLRFRRVPLDWPTQEEDFKTVVPRIISFTNVGGLCGAFVTGNRPVWLMNCRERIRVHPQLCDGPILAFTPLHNVNCNHGLIYVTVKSVVKICQLPSALNYDNDWPIQKIPLRGTPHQIAYHVDANMYALIVSVPVSRTVSQILESSEQGSSYFNELEGEDEQKLVTLEDFEVRILHPGRLGGVWETKATISMHITEHALTVRIVSVKNTSTEQTQSLLSIGTAYVQGEDVPARGRIILVTIGQDQSDPSTWAKEVYCKEFKGAISAIASLQGHLLVAIGPKIILHTWNGTELNGTAFFDAPLYVVSLNIVKNFVLFGDIHKSIYFLCWKEEGAQLHLLAKDFGSLDCFATEFLIDGSTLSLLVSDSQKNIQIFSYAPKSLESWKGQKLLPRAEFHLGAHVTKFVRLQMLPTASSARTNRFALLFGTLDGSIGCIAPVDEVTFRRLQTLQRKLVNAVPHVGGLNPRAFRQFQSNGKVHCPGPENIIDCELLCHYEMLPLEEQLDIAHQIGTTRSQILANLSDLAISTSFL